MAWTCCWASADLERIATKGRSNARVATYGRGARDLPRRSRALRRPAILALLSSAILRLPNAPPIRRGRSTSEARMILYRGPYDVRRDPLADRPVVGRAPGEQPDQGHRMVARLPTPMAAQARDAVSTAALAHLAQNPTVAAARLYARALLRPALKPARGSAGGTPDAPREWFYRSALTEIGVGQGLPLGLGSHERPQTPIPTLSATVAAFIGRDSSPWMTSGVVRCPAGSAGSTPGRTIGRLELVAMRAPIA